MRKEEKIRVGISIGDLNGIGAEIIIKAFEDPSKLAALAALAKEDFDITKLSKQFIAEGKKEITKKINRQNKIVPIRDLF